MENVQQGAPANADKPAIFISHRHDDQPLADVLRRFIKQKTAGAVSIFQSSYEGSGPEIGKILTADLGRHLCDSEVVLLIYTVNDEKWSYCMWECGVAFDPRSDDTRIVVLQCGQSAPAPLSDRVRVRLDNEVNIKQFVRELLTSPSFFPRTGRAISGLEAESREVEELGKELYDELKSLVSSVPDQHWPSWPSITIELPLDVATRIEEMLNEGHVDEARSAILASGVVAEADRWAPALFSRPAIDPNYPLSKLVRGKPSEVEGAPPWVTSLLDQLGAGICERFYPPDWTLFRCTGFSDLRAPMMMNVHKEPSKRRIRFDVSFPRFDQDPNTAALRIGVPAAA